MPNYKVLFADDQAMQHQIFREKTVSILADDNIVFSPLDFAHCLLPDERINPLESIEGLLQKAKQEGSPYDIFITDLNFETRGGGPQDGFDALQMAREFSPSTKLILSTAYGRDVRPKRAMEIAEKTGLQSAYWVDISGAGGSGLLWAQFCKLACGLIDAERAAAQSGLAPDVYEVVVLEDHEESDEDNITKRLKVQIAEKKTRRFMSELILEGDMAIIFEIIADGGRLPVPGKKVLEALNYQRKALNEYVRLTPDELDDFLRKYSIELYGERTENAHKSMCRRANKHLCEWQRWGGIPLAGDEGYSCFLATHTRRSNGYCPKLQRHRQMSTSNSPLLDPEQGSERRKVRELRHLLGEELGGENGLIRTRRSRGYAFAGTLIYPDD